MTEIIMNFNFNYCFAEDTDTQSNLLMWSPLFKQSPVCIKRSPFSSPVKENFI